MNATPIFSPRRWTASLLLIVLCVLTSSQKAAAGKQPKVFSIWKKLPTEQLVKIGHRFANNPEQPDSALLALTIVTNRYDKSMSREDKILVQQAQRMKGFVYLFATTTTPKPTTAYSMHKTWQRKLILSARPQH